MADPFDAISTRAKPADNWDAISEPVAKPKVAAKPSPKKNTLLGDFLAPITGSVDKLKADAGAYYTESKRRIPIAERLRKDPLGIKDPLAIAGLAGDALGVLGSPIAGIQHAALRPLSEAVSSRVPYKDYGSIADQARQIISGKVPKMVTYNPQDSARKLEGDLTSAVSAAMPARGAIGLSGPVIPARVPKATPAVVAAIPKPSPQQVLKDAGVFLTPGQKLGGIAKNTEDLAQRAPILGPAIIGARQRSGESLVRAVANRSLAPLGEVVPPNIKTGHESTAYVADRLGKVYDDAADLVPQVGLDMTFGQNLQQIATRARELPPSADQQLTNILQNRLAPLQNGPVTGRQLRATQSDIGRLAADLGSSDDHAQRAIGEILEDVSDELKGVLSRANPQAGQMIDTANQGWANYVRLRSASAKASKNGIFTPGQFATAVRTADKSVGKGDTAKGQALMQDLSSAASEVMPDAFGNPGTANAIGLGAGLTGLATAPVQTLSAAAGLGAAATPYMLMGRKIVTSLPANPSPAQIQQASASLAKLSTLDPKVIILQQYLAKLSEGQSGLPAIATQAAAQEDQPQ